MIVWYNILYYIVIWYNLYYHIPRALVYEVMQDLYHPQYHKLFGLEAGRRELLLDYEPVI